MKISGNDEIITYMSDPSVNRTEEKDASTQAGKTPPENGDDAVVNLSKRSKEFQLAQKAMDAEPEIRFDKVQEVSRRIQDGTYHIDHGKTGEKMLATFIDEMV